MRSKESTIIDENLQYEAVTGMHIHFERHAVTYFEKKNLIMSAKVTTCISTYTREMHSMLNKRKASGNDTRF